MNWSDEQVPKPFDFVPIHRVKRESSHGHHVLYDDSDDLTFPIRLVFKAKTLGQVQVSTGNYMVAGVGGEKRILLAHTTIRRTVDGKRKEYLVIPGSSLKGAIRSKVEAITDSCLPVVDRTVSSYLRDLKTCSGSRQLCPACSLFGAQGYLGRVSFHDSVMPMAAAAVVRTPNLWQPARGTRLPRSYFPLDADEETKSPQAVNPGRKFYFHRRPAQGDVFRMVIRRGTVVDIVVDIMSTRLSEAGLLMCAVGCHPQYSFPIKLGAAKPVGLGSVDLTLDQAIVYGEKGHRAGRLGTRGREVRGEQLHEWSESAIGAALGGSNGDSLVDIGRLGKLAEIYSADGLGIDAPSGPY